jgi:hypothetical protein
LLVGMVDSKVLDRNELQRLAERIAAAEDSGASKDAGKGAARNTRKKEGKP